MKKKTRKKKYLASLLLLASSLLPLRKAAKKAKINLSYTMQTEINLPFITADASGPKHTNTQLPRSQFEALVYPLLQHTIEPCK